MAASCVLALDKASAIATLIVRARAAQEQWAAMPMSQRLRHVRKIRNEIAVQGLSLCGLFPKKLSRTSAESLASEVIPLAAGCRFLEREAANVLAPRRLSTKSRPFWLRAVDVSVHRDPVGLVLIIGPSNYPLFLPGVQALQALVAGNAVIWKPGRDSRPIADAFRSIVTSAGIPADLFVVLDETIESAQHAISSRVDKVVLTGSVETGRAVYGQLAGELIPAVLELSGWDPVFVQSGANVELAAAAIVFGCEWNGGNTCIAPRRVFVMEDVADDLERCLAQRRARCDLQISITRVRSDEEALELASASGYALGATVFGETAAAEAFASRIWAGVVVVNDMIAPTADPRVPFGGRGCSGFGSTRGAEGLLEFTAPKAVVIQRAKRLRHLEALPHNAVELFDVYLAAFYKTSWQERFTGCRHLVTSLVSAGGGRR